MSASQVQTTDPPRSHSAPCLLSIRNIQKTFGGRPVLRGISLDIPAGEFLTVLGESGSGKTTLLRLIAGFEQPDQGEIWMEDERLDLLPPYRRQVNTVFQSYAIFPHLSVFENVAYGLRAHRVPRNEVPARVERALTMVKMQEFSQSSPARLSGGQQQRVALARALVNRPRILLLDEPLSALDANLRRAMQLELKSLQREVGITFLFVTHDQEEAMALSDRIALLREGLLEQVAAPREIYNCPATAYVAQFIGQTNLLRGNVCDGVAQAGSITWHCSEPSGPTTFSLRPESVRVALTNHIDSAPGSPVARFRGRVKNQTFGGATDLLEIDCGNSQIIRARVPATGPLTSEITFEFDTGDALRVHEADGRGPRGGNH